MALNQFLGVNSNGMSTPRDTAAVINGALGGKLNCLFEGTLTANAASTTFTGANTPGAENIGPESFIWPMPLTANAATELAAGTMYVSAQANESVTVTHANNVQVDRTFRFLVIG